MQTYDVIVLGIGGVGSAALLSLAQRGVRVLGIDRFAPGHDRGSSHGQTRIIRQAYFEHPNYVPLLLASYRLWRELEARRREQLLFEVGLIEIGPPTGTVVPGVLGSAATHNLNVEQLSSSEVTACFAGFVVPENYVAVFEPQAGYLFVEKAVIAQVEEAQRLGAELHTDETILSWRSEGDAYVIQTDRDRYSAGRLVITAGAWAGELLANLGVRLQVLRKQVYWFRTQPGAYEATEGTPAFLYELPQGVFYGFPKIDSLGVKVAEHTGGEPVIDPLALDRQLDPAICARALDFCRNYLPQVTDELATHSTCMYTMTPDEHFIVDRHPEHPHVVFAAGLSGHGFKFAPVLGEILTQLVLDGHTALPIDFLSCRRPGLR